MPEDQSFARWPLVWPHGEATVLAVAGILWRCRFRLASGRWIAPFAAAPWAGEDSAEMRALPGHMRWLGGEFVCLPFGVGGPLREPAPEWRPLLDGTANRPPHGPAADAEWRLLTGDGPAIELAIDYPAEHDVARLTRRITGDPGRPALDFELTVEARRDGAYPVGLHPIFTLPERAGVLRLEAGFELGLTYPGIVEPGAMLTEPGRSFQDLAAVPAPGGMVDLSRLPAGRPAEDVIQMLGLKRPVRVVDDLAKFAVTLDWDRVLIPCCQIRVSDRALTGFPWHGRFRGLGIEPTVSAFDFAQSVSQAANPISARGYPTALPLRAGQPVTIRYRIEAGETL